jgi:hypothetical protein
VKLFVNGESVERVDVPVRRDDVVHVVCALSGG